MLRVALVGDRNSYTRQLSDALQQFSDIRCTFYGPKRDPSGSAKKQIQFSGYTNYRPVWTSRLYALQILRQAIVDRPSAIHFDFTITTFSGGYFEMVFFPLLVPVLRILGLRVVLTVHDAISWEVLRGLFRDNEPARIVAQIVLIVYFKLLGTSNVIVVHIAQLKRVLTSQYRIKSTKILVAPFGVAKSPLVSDVALRSLKSRFDEARIVLAFGVVAPRKGIEYLIDAFSTIAPKYPEAILVLAGPADSKYPGYLHDLLGKATSVLAKKQFAYTGYLDETYANSLFAISTVVVLPYLYAYASPSILYWAMAHGKPVIASAIDTLAEELDGYNATLLPRPKSHEELAVALDTVLNDPNVASEASKYMQAKAAIHSWNKTVDILVRAYEQ